MLRWKLTPHVWSAPRIAQRAERNGELGAPAVLVDLRAHVPRRVPVEVEAAARAPTAGWPPPRPPPPWPSLVTWPSYSIAGRVGAEHEAVLPIAIGVEDHPEAVGVVEVGVAARVGDDDARGLAVVADDADVERVGREDDAHLGVLGGGLPFVGLLLPEAGDRRRAWPPDRPARRRRASAPRRDAAAGRAPVFWAVATELRLTHAERR